MVSDCQHYTLSQVRLGPGNTHSLLDPDAHNTTTNKHTQKQTQTHILMDLAQNIQWPVRWQALAMFKNVKMQRVSF